MASMAAANGVRLETLSRDNYDTWRIQVEALLIKNDTWGYVSGDIPQPTVTGEGETLVAAETAYKNWLTADRKAKADLILSINPTELKQIKNCATSRQVWLKLESIYASKGPARKATLLKRLTLHKMQPSDDVTQHLAEFFDAVDKLQAMDVDINGDLLSIMLLYSLPDTYDNFRCAIESRDNLPDVDTLKVKILEEHNARIQKDSENGSAAMFIKPGKRFVNKSKTAVNDSDRSEHKQKRTFKCSFCNKKGHKEDQCFFKKKLSVQAANKVDEANCCFSFSEPVPKLCDSKTFWCVDSGCTSHMCNDPKMFVNVTETQEDLMLADNSATKVKAKGDVRIETAAIAANFITLKDTLYVPKLGTNLISVAKVVDNNHTVTFEKTRAVIRDSNGNVKVIADRIGNLFYLRENGSRACVITEPKVAKTDMQIWHVRLGHLNARDMIKMFKNEFVTGLKFSDVDLPACTTCLEGKITSTPFSKREGNAKQLLELIHSDVCGPMRETSQGGAKFFVTFIDDYSRWCHVYFLRNKGEVVDKFIEYKNLVENQTGHKIKSFQSDNGKEYCNERMGSILKSAGIQQRLTVPYTPQQNGVAERKNRSLVEVARCMMLESGQPPSLWAEAINTANYIRNRCLTRGLSDGTPYEKWMKRKPDLSHLRTFGEKVVILDKSPNKAKFDPKGKQGIFVGYSDCSKAYRVWVPSDHKIHVSRDVKFLDLGSPEPKQTFMNFYEDKEDHRQGECIEMNPIGEDFSGDTESELSSDGEPFYGFEEDATPSLDDEPFHGFEEEADLPTCHEESSMTKRGRGRPKLVRTGKRGRPAKVYKLPATTGQELTPNVDLSDEEDSISSSVTPAQQLVTNVDSSDVLVHDVNFIANGTEISVNDALCGADREAWSEAIYDEIRSLVKNDTWDIVDRPTNKRVIDCKTVLRNKYSSDGSLMRRKARIVARGFNQRPGFDFKETYSPVARIESFRLLMALAAKFNLHVSQLDITTAFLNGEIDKDIYMEQPDLLLEFLQKMKDVEKDHHIVKKASDMLRKLKSGDKVCKLRKAIYGLRQAGRQWYAKLSATLTSIGLRHTTSDPCVFVDTIGKHPVFVLIYVDDIVIASADPARTKQIKDELSARFDVKDLGAIRRYLGIEVSQSANKITLCQSGYIKEILHRFRMDDCKPVRTPLVTGSKLEEAATNTEDSTHYPFRELIGALMYLAVGTRPDICYAVNKLSQYNNNHNLVHWQAAKRILRYLKGTMDKKLTYIQDKEGIFGFADADWGNSDTDRKSYTGYNFILSGSAISWCARKQRAVALSSTEAEYMSLTEAAKEAIHLSAFMKELGLGNLSNITLFNDNQSAGKLAHNSVFHSKTKHIDIKYHFIRQALQEHPLRLEYQPTEDMVADVLTKALPADKHEKCVKGLGLQS